MMNLERSIAQLRHTMLLLQPQMTPLEALPPTSAERCAALAFCVADTLTAADDAAARNALTSTLGVAAPTDAAGQTRLVYPWLCTVAAARCQATVIAPPAGKWPLGCWSDYVNVLIDPKRPYMVPTAPSADGFFTPREAQITQDVFVYHDLMALHALFGIAARTGDAALRDAVRKAVTYHAEHTQIDYTSSAQPLAAAAFFALDPTEQLGSQQLHDLQSFSLLRASPVSGIAIFLLADALAQLKDYRAAFGDSG